MLSCVLVSEVLSKGGPPHPRPRTRYCRGDTEHIHFYVSGFHTKGGGGGGGGGGSLIL